MENSSVIVFQLNKQMDTDVKTFNCSSERKFKLKRFWLYVFNQINPLSLLDRLEANISA